MITDAMDIKQAINRGEPLKTCVCELCGKEFEQPLSGRKRYCCSKCRGHNSNKALKAPSVKFIQPVRLWIQRNKNPKFASLQILWLDLSERGQTGEYGRDYSKHMIRIALDHLGYEPYNTRVFIRKGEMSE